MATEKAANLARTQFSKELFGKGIHGLQVDTVAGDDKRFCLVAMVPLSFKKQLPTAITVLVGTKEVDVPLVVQKADPFKPE